MSTVIGLNSARVLARIPLRDERVVRSLIDADEWVADPPYQVTIAIEPASGTAADFVAWSRP
jgi:hypothetical protein